MGKCRFFSAFFTGLVHFGTGTGSENTTLCCVHLYYTPQNGFSHQKIRRFLNFLNQANWTSFFFAQVNTSRRKHKSAPAPTMYCSTSPGEGKKGGTRIASFTTGRLPTFATPRAKRASLRSKHPCRGVWIDHLPGVAE